MDGVFVSLVMNGPHTWIHIRQSAGEDATVNNVVLSSTNFASFMFQLKAIEASFIHDAQVTMRNNSIEAANKSVQTDDKLVQTADESVQTVDEFVQMVSVPDEKNTPPTVAPATAKRSRAGTKGELHERLRNAKKRGK